MAQLINLTFTVDNVSTVIQVYNQIRVRRAESQYPADLVNYTTVSGLGPIDLVAGQSIYTITDTTGTADNWYVSQYYHTGTTLESSWSDPILGEIGDLFYDPLFPSEESYGTEEQLVIDRIRRLIGDPLNLRREYGEEAESSIHPDDRTYEFDEKGWPVSIHMGQTLYDNSDLDRTVTVNGYRFLRFNEDITLTTISGVDIWYYTFRHSDRQIMEAYDNCPPPPSLTTTTATSEAYMLQTAVDLLTQEVWEDSGEDGAVVSDEGSRYDPSPGLRMREGLIDKLQKRLDKVTRSLVLSGIGGVLLD